MSMCKPSLRKGQVLSVLLENPNTMSCLLGPLAVELCLVFTTASQTMYDGDPLLCMLV